MANKDLISKQLLRQLIVDFGNQLFGLNIIEAELLSSEQSARGGTARRLGGPRYK